MGVKAFAWCLVVLGLGLALYGWQAWNPVAFVGLVLTALGVVVRLTHRPRGSGSGVGGPGR